MVQIHPNARTTPAVRAEIARSTEPSGVLAQRYSVSTETIRKWRKRGPADCLDRPATPHKLPWKANDEERAVVCALRCATNFALDDPTFVVTHFLPHLNRDSIWRILRAEGLNRRAPPPSDRPRRGQGRFRDYDLGFIHIDIKHLPKLQTANGERQALPLRRHRPALALRPPGRQGRRDRAQRPGFPQGSSRRLSLPLHPCADRQRQLFHAPLCSGLHRPRRRAPHHQTPLSADERHGRALQWPGQQRGAGHHHLLPSEARQPLRGFNAAYNARRQRVLEGKTPDQVVVERIKARRKLTRGEPEGRAGPADITEVRAIAEPAKDLSPPDSHPSWTVRVPSGES